LHSFVVVVIIVVVVVVVVVIVVGTFKMTFKEETLCDIF
jgi:hypothetical protein